MQLMKVLAAATLLSCFALTAANASDTVSVATTRSVPNLRQPQAAVGGDGTIFVAFGADNAIYCSTSSDDGKSYSDPVRVGEVNRLALGMRRGPRIAVSGDAVVIAAVSHADGTVLSWRSVDQGRTWNGPTPISDASPGSANEGLHALAAASDGSLYCVWLDHRLERKNQIFGAASSDGGKTWSENRLIYKSPSGNVCECCHPAVTFGPSGELYVMWRNSLNGFRDMYVASSSDGGKTFGEASKLGQGSWKLNACPMDGGYLAAEEGKLTTVWRRERQIFQADLSGEEQLLASGEQPWTASGPGGAWIVWLSKRGGELRLLAPAEARPVTISGNAADPVIATSVRGEGPVVAVWESGHQASGSILAKVVKD